MFIFSFLYFFWIHLEMFETDLEMFEGVVFRPTMILTVHVLQAHVVCVCVC